MGLVLAAYQPVIMREWVFNVLGLAGNLLMAHKHPEEISKAKQKVTQGEEHNWPFWIMKPAGVEQKGGECDKGGKATQQRPDCKPELCEVLVLL